MDSAAAIGGPGLQLSALDIDLTMNGQAGSRAASKSGAGKGENALEADEAGLLIQLRQRLVQGLMQTQQQQPQLMACLKVSPGATNSSSRALQPVIHLTSWCHGGECT